VKSDSYATASRVNSLVVKISPWDGAKTNHIIDLVGKYVNVDDVLKRLSGEGDTKRRAKGAEARKES